MLKDDQRRYYGQVFYKDKNENTVNVAEEMVKGGWAHSEHKYWYLDHMEKAKYGKKGH